MAPDRSSVALVGGSSHPGMTRRIADELGIDPIEVRHRRFPDGELDVSVDPVVRGCDTYVIQSLGPPVNEHLVELLLLIDASRRAGARRITAVVPYLGYARKDRRTDPGDAVGLAVVASLLGPDRIDGMILVDPHVAQVDSIFSVPLEVVSAVPVLAAEVTRRRSEASISDQVVVAPDLGAVNLAERYARELGVDEMSVIRKVRLSGSEVDVTGLVGDGVDRAPLVVDDMISTGGTLVAAIELLIERWDADRVAVSATHGVFVDDALERLLSLPVSDLVISDSLSSDGVPDEVTVVGLAGRLANTIARITAPGGRGDASVS